MISTYNPSIDNVTIHQHTKNQDQTSQTQTENFKHANTDRLKIKQMVPNISCPSGAKIKSNDYDQISGAQHKLHAQHEIRCQQLTFKNTVGKEVRTDSIRSRPNVRVISVIPSNH